MVNTRFRPVERHIPRYVTDLSRTGAFIRCDDPEPIGSIVDLHLTLVTDQIETIEGKAEVIRISHDPPGMGVRFVELSPQTQWVIERLLTGIDDMNLFDDVDAEVPIPPPIPAS